jgi:hypothetical protein
VASVYPPALIACITDGRCPLDNEVEQIARKTWDEGARFLDAGTPALTSRLVRRALSPEACVHGSDR